MTDQPLILPSRLEAHLRVMLGHPLTVLRLVGISPDGMCQIELTGAELSLPTGTATAPLPASAAPERLRVHHDNFRRVTWGTTERHEEYHFTKRRAYVVRMLWQAMEAGSPYVQQETILRALREHSDPKVRSSAKRLHDLFRGHPAFGQGRMIQPAGDGSYRLAE